MIDDPNKTQEWVMDDAAELLRRINECEKRYQTLIETNLYGVQVINIHGKITYVNAVQCEIMGYSLGDLENKDIWKLLASEFDRKSLTDYLTKLAKDNYVSHAWTGKYLKLDGQILQLQQNWTCMRNEQGNVTGFISVTTRIDNKKKLPPKVLIPEADDKEKKYCPIAESAREMILTFEAENGKITFVNEKGTEVIGYFREELLDMNIADIIPPDQLEELKRRLSRETAENRDIIYYQTEIINRSLHLLPMETSASMIIRKDGQSEILMIAHDISRQKKNEEERLRDYKFETIMRFSSGIVDDLNDFLTVILGNIDFAQITANSGEKRDNRLSQAKKVCMELKELTRLLSRLSREKNLIKETGSLAKFIKNLVRNTEYHIVYKAPHPDEAWLSEFDKAEIQELMKIVMLNAHEAMPSGGQIRITLRHINVSEHTERAGLLLSPGRYVRISVQDQGGGIPKEHLDKIFDPYFTTKKETKKGTGLGLSIAYAIIRKHNGYIYAESKPGIRTVIHIFLPAFVNDENQQTKQKKVIRKGKILVMDDEDIIRDVAGQMLHKLGYETAFSVNGDEALILYQKAISSETPFDAVILDLHVKDGMSGKEAMKKLLMIDTDAKGIVSSGYSNDPEMKDFEKYGFSGVLEKPYTIQDLSTVLDKVLLEKKGKSIDKQSPIQIKTRSKDL